MKLLSINIGRARMINAKSGRSGIFKIPTAAPVRITTYGLEGDAIVDVENHGGEDQAVYVFGSTDYEWWMKSLGKTLAPGTFGENMTISDLESASLRKADRLLVGPVVLEITWPRIPCVTLATRMGDPTFVKRFRQAERPGVYCRVITGGIVQADDLVSLAPYEGESPTVLQMFREYYQKNAGDS